MRLAISANFCIDAPISRWCLIKAEVFVSIDKKYFNFTIRLEYLDLDQGGLMVRILITDN